MSRFSTKADASSAKATKTTNLAGGEAHQQSDRLELASLVLASMLQGRQASAGDDVNRVRDLVESLAKRGDLRFAAQAALYARHTHGLRSITHVLAAEIAHIKGEFDWRKSFFDKIVRRVDDATEIVAYYLTTYCADKRSWTLPNAMKRGLGKALVRFDEYNLAKYQSKGKSVSLVDVVNLVRPKAPSKSPIHLLMTGKIKEADTWESALSDAGKEDNVEKAKASEWARLFKEKQIGYLACLRNLRNIIEQAPKSVDAAIDLLTDEGAVKKSLIFPFQFLNARKAVSETEGDGTRAVLSAINKAMDIAMSNVPTFEGSTLIALDGSGSMDSPSTKTMSCFEIGSLFAAVLLKANPTAKLLLFADKAAFKMPDTDNTIMAVRDEIERLRVNGGTSFHVIFQAAQAAEKAYDRVVILSDMQAWIGVHTPDAAWKSYCVATKADPFIYSFDLAGHGTMQFPEKKVCAIAGWSDKVFDLMNTVEQDRHALVHAIEQVEVAP